jgi:hypothetical protein
MKGEREKSAGGYDWALSTGTGVRDSVLNDSSPFPSDRVLPVVCAFGRCVYCWITCRGLWP